MLVVCREPDGLDEGKERPSARRVPTDAVLPTQPSSSLRTVLQMVALDSRVRCGPDAHNASDLLNDRLLSTLTAAYQLNASRLQLLNLLDVQSSLERLRYVAPARRACPQELAQDLRKLQQFMNEVRRASIMAGQAWELAGSAFTRLTRLLPVQLEHEEASFEPMSMAELRCLARSCAALTANGPTPMPFAEKRLRYERAAAEFRAASAKVARAGNALRHTEDGFRVGLRDVCELASAILECSQLQREWILKTMRACIARDTLHALVRQLPERLRLP